MDLIIIQYSNKSEILLKQHTYKVQILNPLIQMLFYLHLIKDEIIQRQVQKLSLLMHKKLLKQRSRNFYKNFYIDSIM